MKYFLLALLIPLNSFAGTNESSFTPTSVLVPIRGISLGGGEELYSCSGTGDDCLVDIADPVSLAAITASASISAGSYATIRVSSCKDEGSYTAKLKGAVALGGSAHYTTSDANVLSTDINDLDYTSVEYSGCSNEFSIPGGLVVEEGTPVTLNLFATLSNIAWANKSTATVPSGCKSSGTASVCMAYPDVLPSVGDRTPTLETYHIAAGGELEAKAGGQLLLIFDDSDNLLGGFGRRLFSETSAPMVANFDTPLRFASKNGDGTLTLADYGSTADSSTMTYDSFKRESHSGIFSCPDDCGGSGPLYSYEAFKK